MLARNPTFDPDFLAVAGARLWGSPLSARNFCTNVMCGESEWGKSRVKFKNATNEPVNLLKTNEGIFGTRQGIENRPDR
jgi:hypothetical protein